MKFKSWILLFAVVLTPQVRSKPWGNGGIFGYSEDTNDWEPVNYESYSTFELLQLPAREFLDPSGKYVPVHPIYSDCYCYSSRFKNLDDLGRGAQGRVYMALDTITDGHVAIKSLIHPVKIDSENDYINSVRNEEIFLGGLKHPSIPKLYCTFVKKNGHISLVMQHIPGKDLFHQMYPDKVRMDIDRIRTIMRQLVDVLAYLHSQNIAHRDVKLENVLMTDSGMVYLVDFNEALYAREPIFGQAGTPCNMPPEMTQGLPYDDGVDWYGLGLILFELCAKYHPFQDKLNLIPKGVPKIEYKDYSISSESEEDISSMVHDVERKVSLANDLIGHLCDHNTMKRWTYGNGNLEDIKTHLFLQEDNAI
jgi:serine/threonine protein kinase